MFPTMQVDSVEDGQEATNAFKDRLYDFVIMDVDMPVMNGIDAYQEIERICSQKAWTPPVIIFCTGYAPPELIQSLAVENSNYHLLLKPISLIDLMSIIKA